MIVNYQNYYRKIYERYGNVRRARGFYLYTEKGQRLIDMCLDGARSVLGRRQGALNLQLKQKLDKGMLGFFPSPAEYQLEKVLAAIFPNCCFKIFASGNQAFDTAQKILMQPHCSQEKITWRPFANGFKDSVCSEKCFLVAPLFASNITILCIDKSGADTTPLTEIHSDTISQAEVFAVAKSFYEMLRAREQYSPELFQHAVLQQFKTRFELEGIYLFPKESFQKNPQEYRHLWEYFLDNKILLSPNLETPSVFPLLQHYREIEKVLEQSEFQC